MLSPEPGAGINLAILGEAVITFSSPHMRNDWRRNEKLTANQVKGKQRSASTSSLALPCASGWTGSPGRA